MWRDCGLREQQTIEMSHGDGAQQHRRPFDVAEDLAAQISAGQWRPGTPLKPGVSITDGPGVGLGLAWGAPGQAFAGRRGWRAEPQPARIVTAAGHARLADAGSSRWGRFGFAGLAGRAGLDQDGSNIVHIGEARTCA
jgi:hypothetical protein